MTFSAIRDEVLSRCNLTSSDAAARVGDAVNRHYRRITSLLGLETTRVVTVSGTLALGARQVVFEGVEKLDRVFDVTDPAVMRLLPEVSLHRQRVTMPGVAAPGSWAMSEANAHTVTILVDTVAQQVYSLQADGWVTRAELTGTDEPMFPASFHDVLTWFTLAEELLRKEKTQLAAAYEEKAEALLAALRFQLADTHTRDLRQASHPGGNGHPQGTTSGGGAPHGGTSVTQTGLITFDRDPDPPFAVSPGSAPVQNLDTMFLQAGLGAVPRATNTSKLRDWLSVKDFGAQGVGGNDTAAIKAAIAAVKANGRGTVYVPAGLYGINETLVLDGFYMNLVGDGPGTSQIQLINGSNCSMVRLGGTTAPGGYGAYNVIDGLLLFTDKTQQTTGHGIEVRESIRPLITNCVINTMKMDGIHLGATISPWIAYPQITQCMVSGCDNFGIWAELGVYSLQLLGNTISHNGKPGGAVVPTLGGVYLTQNDTHRIVGNLFDENSTGLRLNYIFSSAITNNLFINNYAHNILSANAASTEIALAANSFITESPPGASAYANLELLADRWTITGNTFAGAVTRTTGISLAATSEDNIVSDNVMTPGAATTPITDLGTRTRARDNVGVSDVVTSAVTGTQHDWAITGAGLVEWSGASAATITGLAGGFPGATITIRNTGAQVITFAHNHAGSLAVNRLGNVVTGAPTPVAARGHVTYRHDGTLWHLVSHEQGAWILPPYAAGNFTAGGAMTWTVEAGDVTAMAYRLDGSMLTVAFTLQGTVIGGTVSSALILAIPGGFTAAREMHHSVRIYDLAWMLGEAATYGDGSIYITRVDSGNWTANIAHVMGQIAFEVG